jgi:F420-dependent methylenetetrahydromethanopterin dehydrogenase
MSSKSLVPATTQALVPYLTRQQKQALKAVGTAARVASMKMEAAYQLSDLASQDVTSLAVIHEAMIEAAPLADDNLERIRNAHTRVAERIIGDVGSW